ncbi:acylneuraminate cytidylyltransferase family protein [Microbulbifer sp. SAOS-129_SWC]|uniref:acylneuraminate cytidylyltransferase family protein n=1 Tax=Microbulbifer sp. SAOS-129_SWC TaxID=3145235 RepID=UPI003217A7C2
MQKKKVIALLPMKANSERVKGKNFKRLGDKPLFRWILDSLLAVEAIDQVVINTDARDILAENGLVESDRVRIRDRRKELCGDLVSMNLILEDDLEAIESDLYLMTHTTNPLISAETIERAISTFMADHSSDSLFSVNRTQTRFYREDGSPVNHDPDNLVRTQDLEPWLEENSCLYLFTRQSFATTRARIGSNPQMFETPRLESLDIDEPYDWELVSAVVNSNKEG